MFTAKYNVIIEDLDKNLKMNNRAFLRMLQETGNLASSQVGYGIEDIERTGVSWVLLYWRIKIFKRAKYGEEVTVKSWARFERRLYSIRNFEVYVGDELIAKAESKWALVDIVKHSILKITDDIIEKYKSEKEKIFEDNFKDRIKFEEDAKELFTYTTMKRDLDANNHVNNIVYLDIANEVIEDNIQLESTEINIVYKKEIGYKDTVTLYQKEDKIYLYNKEKDILHAMIVIK